MAGGSAASNFYLLAANFYLLSQIEATDCPHISEFRDECD